MNSSTTTLRILGLLGSLVYPEFRRDGVAEVIGRRGETIPPRAGAFGVYRDAEELRRSLDELGPLP